MIERPYHEWMATVFIFFILGIQKFASCGGYTVEKQKNKLLQK